MMDTTFDLWSILVLLGLGILVLRGFWVIVPRMHDLPRKQVHAKQIRQAMSLADVQPGELVYDLNAGDGRAVVIAARDYQARAVGISIEPLHWVVAWLWALVNGVARRISIHRHKLLETDLKEADVVFLHLTPTSMEQLRPRLPQQLRPGARVVSLNYQFEGWQPAGIDVGHLIFLYSMPPSTGNIESYMRQSLSPNERDPLS
jgi:hypothetical protein